ncbi:MAG: DUF2155 domain-containing protein [Alphaproteobacteria bacterium]|jgi:hypothetical protein|tara:strand:+ start:4828 stop:5292 length:465 start_codon:yes stop_codon:yes gene_type:complete
MNNVIKGCKFYFIALMFLILPLLVYCQNSYSNSNISQTDITEGNITSISILDKITAKVIKLDIPINTVFYYKEIEIKPKKCFIKNILSNNLNAFSNLEINKKIADNSYIFLFDGWFFKSRPGLNSFEHPIYDIWLNSCKRSLDVISVGNLKKIP